MTGVLSLIPLLPFVGFVVNAVLGRRLSKTASGGTASAVMVGSFLIAASQVWALVSLPVESREISQRLFTWIASGDFVIDLAFRLDPLAAVMILVITGIGSLIHIYSTAYMHEETDSEYARYFSYLNLFVFFMLLLVLGSNVLVMFVGWEGVGLCSYLLIGFYYERKSAADAAKKAFVVNRVGDYAFILGTLLAVVTLGTLDFKEMATRASTMPVETTFGTLSIITLLFFIGATGKSAQIPLYTWLPDAMEGPTPVSALIHAATMVTAGVYMIGRNAVLFSHAADTTLQVVAVVGAATALFAGTIALVQNDIKRVLAYSTVSQLGYMFLAMGVGAFGAGIFHLYTHAFFKALLFLGSGAVIHALHGEQDIRNMGGLRKGLPITYWTFLIGSIAIAGVPPLAGFFSKDEILFETFRHGHQVLWVIGVLTSLLTAFYMFRLVFLTFHGASRRTHAGAHTPEPGHSPEPSHGRFAAPAAAPLDPARLQPSGHDAHLGHGGHLEHLHEAPPAMAFALIVLAVGSIGAGWLGIPHVLGGHNVIGTYLEPSFVAANCPPGDATVQTGALAGIALESCEPGDVARASALGTPMRGEPALAAAPALQPRWGALQPQPTETALQTGEPAVDAHDETALELTLMTVSTIVALIGIGMAAFFYLHRLELTSRLQRQFAPIHRLLLNKYYVDELYDATVVQPIHVVSREGLWRGVDVRLVDGAVDGTGRIVAGFSAVLRLVQNGSVKTYAASTFLGVVAILAYYIWR
ncbi:MAG: NADH-quinone oxidoreductase subunit L [Vicinamibacterales bacterium]